jgi:hypothetical protein
MNKRIIFIDPFSLGSVLAYIYGVVGVLVSISILIAFFCGTGPGKGSVYFTLFLVVFAPAIYALVGLIQGIVIAYLFNFAAKRSGGIKVKFEE